MYRFLLSPRWLALALLMALAAAVMVGLGRWQLHRYELRSAWNDRVDTAASRPPVPLESVLPPPGAGAEVGTAPSSAIAWTRVTITGRYDRSHEILARGRTVQGQVGFEVLTPLVLADGSAVLVDRGWVPPPLRGGAAAFPDVPAPPGGEVTVTGALHRPESRATAADSRDGRLEVRRIAPAKLASALPYPMFGGYVTVDSPADGFTAIPPDHQNAWQNFGYVIQWWLLAGLTLVGYGYLARREARHLSSPRTVSMVSASEAGLSSR